MLLLIGCAGFRDKPQAIQKDDNKLSCDEMRLQMLDLVDQKDDVVNESTGRQVAMGLLGVVGGALTGQFDLRGIGATETEARAAKAYNDRINVLSWHFGRKLCRPLPLRLADTDAYFDSYQKGMASGREDRRLARQDGAVPQKQEGPASAAGTEAAGTPKAGQATETSATDSGKAGADSGQAGAETESASAGTDRALTEGTPPDSTADASDWRQYLPSASRQADAPSDAAGLPPQGDDGTSPNGEITTAKVAGAETDQEPGLAPGGEAEATEAATKPAVDWRAYLPQADKAADSPPDDGPDTIPDTIPQD